MDKSEQLGDLINKREGNKAQISKPFQDAFESMSPTLDLLSYVKFLEDINNIWRKYVNTLEGKGLGVKSHSCKKKGGQKYEFHICM